MKLLLSILIYTFCLSAFPKGWEKVVLQSSVTHVQPMTGLVLWPHEARRLNETYGKAIQLEFSYCLPSKVVRGCNEDGSIEYDWRWFDAILDDVASRGHQLIARFRYEYPGNRDVDGKTRGMTAVPQYIKDMEDYEETYNDVPGDGPTFYADWSNQELMRFTKQFYTDFATRYADDPRLAFVEVGFGHWSEYHIYGTDLRLGKNFPSKAFQREFFLHLKEVMGRIPYVVGIDAADSHYSPFVNDDALMALKFGSFDDSFMHERHEGGYNEKNWIAIGKGTRWQTGVCGGEVSYYKDTDQKGFLNPTGMYGHTWEEQAGKYHISFMIANDAPRGPYGTAKRFREAGMHAGYRFCVTHCETNGKATRITVCNKGIAPLYRDAYFAIGHVRSDISLKGLLPGEEVVLTIPAPLSRDKKGNAITPPSIVSASILPSQEIQYECSE